MKKVIKMYLHSDKDSNQTYIEEDPDLQKMSDEAQSDFRRALYEIEFDVEVDLETGDTRMIAAREL